MPLFRSSPKPAKKTLKEVEEEFESHAGFDPEDPVGGSRKDSRASASTAATATTDGGGGEDKPPWATEEGTRGRYSSCISVKLVQTANMSRGSIASYPSFLTEDIVVMPFFFSVSSSRDARSSSYYRQALAFLSPTLMKVTFGVNSAIVDNSVTTADGVRANVLRWL